jgi:hypothetical protein
LIFLSFRQWSVLVIATCLHVVIYLHGVILWIRILIVPIFFSDLKVCVFLMVTGTVDNTVRVRYPELPLYLLLVVMTVPAMVVSLKEK